MPTTPGGIVYPNSSDHTRMWEHIQDTAESVDAAAGGELDKLPRGLLGHAFRGSAMGIDTIPRAIINAQVTIPAGRKLKVTAGALFNGMTVTPVERLLGIYMGAAAQGDILERTLNNGYHPLRFSMILTPPAGTHNFLTYAWVNGGTAQVNGGQPNFIMIEDVGGV